MADHTLITLYSSLVGKLTEKSSLLAPRPSPEYSCGKRNLLYPIQANSFVSIIMYLTCTIIVLQKALIGEL
jgi:hypothetical protein